MDKKELRRYIAQQKRNYSVAQKTEWSSSLFQKLEGHPLFLQAHTQNYKRINKVQKDKDQLENFLSGLEKIYHEQKLP
jgi:5-formyltetrahydrofolate cyclo-ligase